MGLFDIFKPKTTETTNTGKGIQFDTGKGVHINVTPGYNNGVTGTPQLLNTSGDRISVRAGIESGIDKGDGKASYTPGATDTTKAGSLNIVNQTTTSKPKTTSTAFKPKVGQTEDSISVRAGNDERFRYDRASDKLSERAHRAGLRAGEDYDNISDDQREYIDTYYNTLDRAEITKPYLELEQIMRDKDYSSDKFDTKYQQLMDYIDKELEAERKANGATSKQYQALEQVKQDVTRLGAQYAVDKQYDQSRKASGQLDESINAIFAGVMNSKDYDSTVNAGRKAVSQNSSAKKWFDKNMANASETQRNLMYYTYQKEGMAGVKELYNDYLGETLSYADASKDFISDVVNNPDKGGRFWEAAKANVASTLGGTGSYVSSIKQLFSDTESDPSNRELIAGYTTNDAIDTSLRDELGAIADSPEFEQIGSEGFAMMRAYGVNDDWYKDAAKNATDFQKQYLGYLFAATDGDATAVQAVWESIKESEEAIWQAVRGANTLPYGRDTVEGDIYRRYLGLSGGKAPTWLGGGDGQTMSQLLWDAASTVNGQIPQLAGNLAGMLLALIPGGQAIAPFASRVLGAGAMTIGAYGNTYKATRDEGYNKTKSGVYAGADAAMEFISDYLFSGIGPVKGLLNNKMTSKIVANIANPISRAFTKLGINMLSEGGQEYFQAINEPLMRNVLLGESNDFSLYTEEAKYNFFMGAFSAAILGSLDADTNLKHQIRENIQNKDIGQALKAQGSAKKLVDVVLNQEVAAENKEQQEKVDEAKEFAKSMLDGGFKESDTNVGELLSKAAEAGFDLSFLTNPETVSYTKEQLSVDDLRAGAVSRLAALGGNTAMAEDVAKMAKGMSVSEESQSAIQKDAAATQVLQELQGELNLEENNALTIAARASQVDGTFAKITAAVQANNPDTTILSPNAQFIKEQGVGLADAQRIGAVFDKVMDGHQITKDEAKLVNVRNKGINGALLARLDIDLMETASADAVMKALNEKAAQIARVKDMQAGVKQATQARVSSQSGTTPASKATQNARQRRRGKKNGTKGTSVQAQAGTEAAAGAEAQSLRGTGTASGGQVAAGGPGGVRTLPGGVDVSQRGERLESSVRGPGDGDVGEVIPVDQLTESQRNTQRRLAADGFGSIHFMNGGVSHVVWNEDLSCYEVYIRADGPFNIDQYGDHETGHLWVKSLSDSHREQFFQLVRNAFGEDFREAFTQIRQKYVGLGVFPKDVDDNRVIEEMYCFARGAQNCAKKGLKDSILKFDFSKFHDAMLEIEQLAGLEDMAKGNLNNPQVRQNYENGNFNREYYERQGYLDEDFAPAPQTKTEEKKPTIPAKKKSSNPTLGSAEDRAQYVQDQLSPDGMNLAEAIDGGSIFHGGVFGVPFDVQKNSDGTYSVFFKDPVGDSAGDLVVKGIGQGKYNSLTDAFTAAYDACYAYDQAYKNSNQDLGVAEKALADSLAGKKSTTEKRTEAKQTLDKLAGKKEKSAEKPKTKTEKATETETEKATEAKAEKPKKSKSKKAPIPAKSEVDKLKEHYDQRKAAQQRKFDEGKLSKTEEQLKNKLKKLDNEYQHKLIDLYKGENGNFTATPEAIVRAENLSDEVRNDLISELAGLQAELKADSSIADNTGFLNRVQAWFDKANAALNEANTPKLSAREELKALAQQLVANPELENDPEFRQKTEEATARAIAEMAERAANAQVSMEELAEEPRQETRQEKTEPAFDYDAELKKLDDWRNARRKSQYEKMAKNPEKSDASLNAQLKKIEDQYQYKKQALAAKARRNGDPRFSVDPDEDFDIEDLMDRTDEMRSGYNEAQIWQDSSLNEEDVTDTDIAQPSAEDDYDTKMDALMAEMDAHPERMEEIVAQMTALAEERSASNTRALEERSTKSKPKKTEQKKPAAAKAFQPKTEPAKADWTELAKADWPDVSKWAYFNTPIGDISKIFYDGSTDSYHVEFKDGSTPVDYRSDGTYEFPEVLAAESKRKPEPKKTEQKKPVIPTKAEAKAGKAEPKVGPKKAEEPATAKAFKPKAETAKPAPVNEAAPELKKPELHRGQNPVDVKGLNKKKAIDKVTRAKADYEAWYAQEKSKLDQQYDSKKLDDARYAKEVTKLTERRNKDVGRYNDQLKRLEVLDEAVKEKPTVIKDKETKYTPKVGEWWRRIKNGTNIQIRRLRSDRNTYDVSFTDSKGNQVVYEEVSPSMLEKALGEGFKKKADAKAMLSPAYESAASSLGEWQSVNYAKRAEEVKPGKPKADKTLDNYGRKISYQMETRMANSTVRDQEGRLMSVYRLGPANGTQNANPNARYTLWAERPATMNLMRGLNGVEAYDQAGKKVGANIEKWLQELEEHPKMSEGNKNAIRAKIAAAERKMREYTTHITRLDPFREGYTNPKRADVIGNKTLLEGYVDIRNPLVIDAKGKGMAFVRDTIQDFVNDPANLAGQVDVDGNALGEHDGIKFINVTVTDGNKSLGGGQLDRDTIYATFRANQGKSTYNTAPTDSELMQYSLDPEVDDALLDEYDTDLWATDPDTAEIIGIQDLDGNRLSKGQAEYFAGSVSVNKDGDLVRGVAPLWLSSDTFGFLAYDNKGRSDDGLSIFLSDDFLVGGSYAAHGDRVVDLMEYEKVLQGVADRLGVDLSDLPNVGDLVSVITKSTDPKTGKKVSYQDRMAARKKLAEMYNAAIDAGNLSQEKIVPNSSETSMPKMPNSIRDLYYNDIIPTLNSISPYVSSLPRQTQAPLDRIRDFANRFDDAVKAYEDEYYDDVIENLDIWVDSIYAFRDDVMSLASNPAFPKESKGQIRSLVQAMDKLSDAIIQEERFGLPTSIFYNAPQYIVEARMSNKTERYDDAMNLLDPIIDDIPDTFYSFAEKIEEIDSTLQNLEYRYEDGESETLLKVNLFDLSTEIRSLNRDFDKALTALPFEIVATPEMRVFIRGFGEILTDFKHLASYAEKIIFEGNSSVAWRTQDGSVVTINDVTEVLPNSASWAVYAKTANPFIVEGRGASWAKIDMSGYPDFVEWLNKRKLSKVTKSSKLDKLEALLSMRQQTLVKTRDVAKYAAERGYDSAIIKDIVDIGGPGAFRAYDRPSNIYVVFNPEQIKSVGNLNPTNSEMMNHSIDPDTETGYAEGTLEDTILRVLHDKDYDHAVESLTMYLAQYLQTGVLPEIENERTRQIFQPRITPAEHTYLNEKAKELIDRYGAFEPGETPARNVFLPKVREDGNIRQTYRTAAEASATPEWGLDFLKREALTNKDAVYKKITDKSAIAAADRDFRNKGYEQMLAEWRAKADSDAAYKIDKNDIAKAVALYSEAFSAGNAEDAMAIIAEIAEVETTSAQIVQAARLIKHMPPSYQLYYLRRVVNRLNNQYRKRIDSGRMSEIKINKDLAKAVLNAKSQEELDKAMKALIEDVAKNVPVTGWDQWNAWRYLSMLGNPKTHIRNIFGNALFVPAKFSKDLIAAGLEGMFIKNRLERRTSLKGVVGRNSEYRDFAKQDYEGIKQELQSGGKYNMTNEIMNARTIFKWSKGLEFLRKFNGDALEAEDGAFLRFHYVNALTNFLATQGMSVKDLQTTPEGRKIMNAARLYAFNEAQKATYRDASQVAAALNQLKQKSGPMGLLFEGVFPFAKTPVNILKRGVEYSPIGLLDSLSRGLVQLKNGDITANELIDRVASGLTGTGIAALGWWLSSLGLLRGGGDDDDKQNDFDKLQGYQDYSINLGGINYTIDWAAPVALSLFVGSEIFHQLSEGGELTLADGLNALLVIAEPLTQLSMLSGINDLLTSTKYDDHPLSSAIETMASSYLTQALPTLVAQLSRSMTADRRTTFVDKNSSIPQPIQRWWQTNVMGKTPLNAQRTEYIDAWGRKDTTASFAARLFENMVSPGYVNRVNTTAVDEELQKLADKVGTGVLMTTPERKIEYNNETHYLTAEQYQTYAKTRGDAAMEMLTDLFNSEGYQNDMTDDEKAYAVNAIKDYANVIGKQAVFNDYDPTTDNWAEKCDGDPTRITNMAMLRAEAHELGVKTNSTAFHSVILNASYLTPVDQAYAIAQTLDLGNDAYVYEAGKSSIKYAIDSDDKDLIEEHYRQIFPAYYLPVAQTDQWINATLEEKAKLLSEVRSEAKADAKAWLATIKAAQGAPLYVKK